MDFYSLLARHYDEIFPLEPRVVDFASSALAADADPRTLLDIGCATGSLGLALAARGETVVGIDLDQAMIDIARTRARAVRSAGPGAGRAEFLRADMLRPDPLLIPGSFGLVICLGNTLVHLPDRPALEAFLRRVRALLAPRGVLLLQILNYERIRRAAVRRLPVIETRSLVFRREYRDRPDGRLDFQIELFDKESGVLSVSALPLLPLEKDELDGLLAAAAFDRRDYYGGYSRTPFDRDDLLLVCEARSVDGSNS
jgi:glycine/sarcosine N-methyltransferase